MRTAPEINKKRGERVKQLLKENKMEQKDLAALAGYGPEHFNAALNGRRTLGAEMAQRIAAVFPPTLPEWILCETDCRTERQRQLFPLASVFLSHRQRIKAVDAFLETLDLCIENNVDTSGEIATLKGEAIFEHPDFEAATENFFDDLINLAGTPRAYRLVRNSTKEILGYFSRESRDHFYSDLYDYAEFKLNKLIEGAGNNG